MAEGDAADEDIEHLSRMPGLARRIQPLVQLAPNVMVIHSAILVGFADILCKVVAIAKSSASILERGCIYLSIYLSNPTGEQSAPHPYLTKHNPAIELRGLIDVAAAFNAGVV